MVKEGATKYSRCQKCTDQKKGCKWLDAKAMAKGEKPPSIISNEGLEKGKEKEQEPTKCETRCKSTTSQELTEPSIHVNPSRDRSLKCKTPDDTPAPISQSQLPPHHVSIVVFSIIFLVGHCNSFPGRISCPLVSCHCFSFCCCVS